MEGIGLFGTSPYFLGRNRQTLEGPGTPVRDIRLPKCSFIKVSEYAGPSVRGPSLCIAYVELDRFLNGRYELIFWNRSNNTIYLGATFKDD